MTWHGGMRGLRFDISTLTTQGRIQGGIRGTVPPIELRAITLLKSETEE